MKSFKSKKNFSSSKPKKKGRYLRPSKNPISQGPRFRKPPIFEIPNSKEVFTLNSNAKDRKYLDLVQTIVIAISKDQTVLDINTTGCEILGCSEEDIIGQNWFENFIPERIRKSTQDVFNKLMAGEIQLVEYFENPVVRKDGEERVIHWHNSVLVEDEEIVATLASGIDITDQKQAEIQTKGQNQTLGKMAAGKELQEILDSLVEEVAKQIAPVKGSILLLDQENKRLSHGSDYGLPKSYTEAIDGVPIGPNVGSCGTAAHFKTLVIAEDIATDSRWENFRNLALSHGLKACWSAPIFDSVGNVLGAFAFYYSQSRKPIIKELELLRSYAHLAGLAIEQRNIKEKLTESERKLSTLVSNLPGMVYRCKNNKDWTMEYVSEGCRALIGYKPDHLLGSKNVSYGKDVIHPEDREKVWVEVNKALKNTETFQLTYRIRTKFGEEKVITEKGKGIYSDTGEVLALEGFITDITEKYRLEIQTELRYQYQKEISEFGKSALEGKEPLELMGIASDKIPTIIDVEFVEIMEFLYGGQGFLRRYGKGWNEADSEGAILSPEQAPQAAFTLNSTDPVRVANFELETRFLIPGFVKEHRIKSGVTIGIQGKTQPFGILGVYSRQERQFSKDEITFLESIAHVIAWAIRRKNVESKLKQLATQLEQNRDEIKESESRLESVINSALDGNIVIDEKGTVLLFNPAAEEIFGYSADEVLNKNVKMLMPEPYKGEHDEYLHQYMKTGMAKIIGKGRELTGLRKDNSTFDMDLAVSEMNWHGKQVYLGVVRDITESNLIKKELEDYTNKLKTMVENRTSDLNKTMKENEAARNQIDAILKSIADGLIVTDKQNRIILMNRTAEEILETRFSEVINKSIESAIKNSVLSEKINSSISGEHRYYDFDFEFPASRLGHSVIVHARTSQIQDQDGQRLGNVTIIHDVTRDREMDRMKSDFISTVAHEFRTPLSSIRGFSEILLKRENLEEQDKRDYLTFIHEETLQLNNLVSDLLDISKIESGIGFSLNKDICNVAELIKSNVKIFETQTNKHHFPIMMPEEILEWEVDKEKMAQVMNNLYSNAIKYSPQGGEIKTAIKQINSKIQICIQDQGMGMTAGQISRVFDKFYRVDASNTAIEGTGLGMTIVKNLVEIHGGEITVESEIGKGTKITLLIPAN